MSDVTRILSQVESGDPLAAEQLLPLVYQELRKLAAQKLSQEKPGQTLQATALVHEAYVRLIGSTDDEQPTQPQWENRRHFFAAAAESMRRILVDAARRKKAEKHGGGRARSNLDEALLASADSSLDLLELNDLLERLATIKPQAAELVKLRFFAGLTGDEAAEAMGISPRAVDSLWAYARAWLFEKLHPGGQ